MSPRSTFTKVLDPSLIVSATRHLQTSKDDSDLEWRYFGLLWLAGLTFKKKTNSNNNYEYQKLVTEVIINKTIVNCLGVQLIDYSQSE